MMQTVIQKPSQANLWTAFGTTVRCLVSAEQTDGAWSLVEYHTPAQRDGPPPHCHATFTESFYVTEGVLTFDIAGEKTVAERGTYITVPPNIRHTVHNRTSQPAGCLIWMSPGGFERYFAALSELESADMPMPLLWLKLHNLWQQFDMSP